MVAKKTQRNGRDLAGIEGDLIQAEQDFSDADARFRQAQKDRRIALEKINLHQTEMDETSAEIRKNSIPGTRWRLELDDQNSDEALELHSEDIVPEEEPASRRPNSRATASDSARRAFSKDFELLKASSDPAEDPVLKVVAGPKS